MFTGKIETIHLIREHGGDPERVATAVLDAGKGLRGDRYHTDAVNGAMDLAEKDQLTLIEAEALEAVAAGYGVDVAPGCSRRNIVVRGVPLNHLVGRRFRMGGAVLRGVELCEPCGYLAKKTDPKVTKGLIHRGGIRAVIVEGGTIREGDGVSPLSSS